MGRRRISAWVLLCLLPMLSGCLVHTRRVQRPVMPPVVMTATAGDLVQKVNEGCQAIQSLSASVIFQATVGGPRKGKEKTYTSFDGYILLRKPEALRVIGLVPVLHTRAFDMASDGQTFKLWIPHKNEVFEGPNAVTTPSKNTLENFRPDIFSDSLLIHCIGPEDLVTLTEENPAVYNRKTHKLLSQPEYELTVLRRKGSGQELVPERVIHFDRTNLRPIEEDIYNARGAIQTQAIYGADQTFGTVQFPGSITIRRPLEEYQIVITFTKLITNLKLNDDQFQLKTPPGTKVKLLH